MYFSKQFTLSSVKNYTGIFQKIRKIWLLGLEMNDLMQNVKVSAIKIDPLNFLSFDRVCVHAWLPASHNTTY